VYFKSDDLHKQRHGLLSGREGSAADLRRHKFVSAAVTRAVCVTIYTRVTDGVVQHTNKLAGQNVTVCTFAGRSTKQMTVI